MNTLLSQLLRCIVVTVIVQSANADDNKRELKEDRYYDANGKLTDVVSYYFDTKGQKVRHGDNVEYTSYSTITHKYLDGKKSSTHHESSLVHALSHTPFVLTTANPIHKEFDIELLDIAEDGTVRIRSTSTKSILSAKPGAYFVSDEFGREGLKLEAASATKKSAVFTRTSCETIDAK